MFSKDVMDIFVKLCASISESEGNSSILSTERFVYYLSLYDEDFIDAFCNSGGDIKAFRELMSEVSDTDFDLTKQQMDGNFNLSADDAFGNAIAISMQSAVSDNRETITVSDLLKAFYLIKADVVKYFNMTGIESYPVFIDNFTGDTKFSQLVESTEIVPEESDDDDADYDDGIVGSFGFPGIFGAVMGSGNNKLDAKQKKKVFENCCTDLIKMAEEHKEPLVGRESEIDKTIRILCRKEKNNVIHLGEAGVGKTAITLGLAKAILNDEVPEKLKKNQLYSLDLGSLMAGTSYRGELEQKIQTILEVLNEKDNPILYIDEIHNIVGGDAVGAMNIANLIKKALIESKIKFIGATTYNEYKNTIEKDNALARRFKTVEVKEPSTEQTKKILQGIIPYYEDFHGVKYTDDAVDTAIKLSVKYIHDKYLPDKAIDLIDESGAYMSKNNLHDDVTKSLVEQIVSENYNIPKETVTSEDNKLIFTLEDNLKKVVFGQNEAIMECVKSIKLSRAGLLGDNKPVASLLFVGQTGVGKTEIARQLASSMDIDFVKFDMSEYMDETSVNKLIGASSGYVGYEDGGLLVEEIRKHPHCVLLLDEIEKANPKVFNLLLQVMDDAKLTDNKGRVADFKNVVMIMTSNAGASGIKTKALGFGAEDTVDYSQMNKAVENLFTPEFRNRLTKVIVLNPMNDDMAKKIAKKELNNLVTVMKSKGVTVTYTPSVVKYCMTKGITKEFGARPIIRLINDDIKMLFVDDLLAGTLTKAQISIKDNKVTIRK